MLLEVQKTQPKCRDGLGESYFHPHKRMITMNTIRDNFDGNRTVKNFHNNIRKDYVHKQTIWTGRNFQTRAKPDPYERFTGPPRPLWKLKFRPEPGPTRRKKILARYNKSSALPRSRKKLNLQQENGLREFLQSMVFTRAKKFWPKNHFFFFHIYNLQFL